MKADEFEASQRAREYFHGLAALPGTWIVIRVDGRGFSRLTGEHFAKPFDARFSELMVQTAQALFTELGAHYAYTESDEISLLFDPRFGMFGRGVEKLVSLSAGIASAAFTHASGVPAHFDSRLWLGTTIQDVGDYFSWRQTDAVRCALNGWCYWTLREQGLSKQQAATRIDGASASAKNELLFQHGINFNEVPAWQRRGIGLWWETFERQGFDPIREIEVTTTRRRVRVERDLPMKQDYREFVEQLAQMATP